MKKLILVLTVFALLIACKKEVEKEPSNPPEIEGNWRLIEVLADPGDGSGTFQVVVSNKLMEFNSNGAVSCNGNLCDMSTTSVGGTNGTYSTVESTISSPTCVNTMLDISYQIVDSYLIISYPCFEACQCKFEKLN